MQDTTATPPNVILILTDQHQRRCLGCYGNDIIRTPHIDCLADNGVIFGNQFAANTVCMPSRASLLTGRMPTCHGLKANGIRLPERERTLPMILADHGYRTASFGKIHLSPVNAPLEDDSPESYAFWQAGRDMPLPYYGFGHVELCDEGYQANAHYLQYLNSIAPDLAARLHQDRALDPPSGAPCSWKSSMPVEHHPSTWIGDRTIAYLRDNAASTQPFFLHVSFPDPHFPFCPPQPYASMYDPADVPMPSRSKDELDGPHMSPYLQVRLQKLAASAGIRTDMPEAHIREIIAHTYGMIHLVDDTIGRILHELDTLHLRDNTIIIFTSDHGEHLGDHYLLFKCAPYDELTHVGMIWNAPQTLPVGHTFDGLSSHIDFVPTLLDMLDIPCPHGVQGISHRDGIMGTRDTGRPYILVEDDDVRSDDYNRTIRTAHYRMTRYAGLGMGDLFDLDNDPTEFANRYSDPQYRTVRDELTEQLLDATLKHIDPLPTSTVYS